MNLTRFVRESGFKVLALAHLSPCEYSLILYLLNCNASGMKEIVTTYSELALSLGYDEEPLKLAVLALIERKMIKLTQADLQHSTQTPSLRVGFEFEIAKWNLNLRENITTQDAVIYPFFRLPRKIKEQQTLMETTLQSDRKWDKVLKLYLQDRSFSEKELAKEEESARTLIETHPLEQILLILEHFGKRIRNLSLLASSWQHFHDSYEQETQKVDLMEARKKHHQLDEKLKLSAREWLSKFSENILTQEELSVLKLIASHTHPRRQLYWAYQAREHYGNLTPFFEETSELMLSITTSGAIVKKEKPPQKRE